MILIDKFMLIYDNFSCFSQNIIRGGSMQREERVLRDLCIEIAQGDIGGRRFNELLLDAGIILDEDEWRTANRLLGKSDELRHLSEMYSPQQ